MAGWLAWLVAATPPYFSKAAYMAGGVGGRRRWPAATTWQLGNTVCLLLLPPEEGKLGEGRRERLEGMSCNSE